MITGGTPVSISFGGEEFVFTGDSTPELDDGIEVTQESNADGSVRELYSQKPWTITGCEVEADFDKYELLVNIKNTVGGTDTAIELSNGDVLTGTGKPTGTVKFNPTKATASFEAGGGRTSPDTMGLKKV